MAQLCSASMMISIALCRATDNLLTLRSVEKISIALRIQSLDGLGFGNPDRAVEGNREKWANVEAEFRGKTWIREGRGSL